MRDQIFNIHPLQKRGISIIPFNCIDQICDEFFYPLLANNTKINQYVYLLPERRREDGWVFSGSTFYGKMMYVWQRNWFFCSVIIILKFPSFITSCETVLNTVMLQLIIGLISFLPMGRERGQHQFQLWNSSSYDYETQRFWLVSQGSIHRPVWVRRFPVPYNRQAILGGRNCFFKTETMQYSCLHGIYRAVRQQIFFNIDSRVVWNDECKHLPRSLVGFQHVCLDNIDSSLTISAVYCLSYPCLFLEWDPQSKNG